MLAARDGAVTCQAEPIRDGEFPDPVRLELAAGRSTPRMCFSITRRLTARFTPLRRPAAERATTSLLYNPLGEVTETLRGNIVVRCGNKLWTPPVSCGLLAGTYRVRLLAEGKIR